ncbi:unnamed protein product, partial [Rotaria sordida]
MPSEKKKYKTKRARRTFKITHRCCVYLTLAALPGIVFIAAIAASIGIIATQTATSTQTQSTSVSLRWNQTGIRVAGTGSAGTNANELHKPSCLYIDANSTLYICDYENNRIQKWLLGASNGTTVTGNSGGSLGSGLTELNKPMSIVFDKNGYMYVSDQENYRIQKYSPNSNVGTTVAGQTGSSGSSNNEFGYPN